MKAAQHTVRLVAAWGFVAAMLAMGSGPDAHAQDRPARDITIATGGISGLYYPVGGAICRLVNRNPANDGFRCDVDVTGGSVANLKLLLDGFNEFAIVQSDILATLPAVENPGEARRRLRAAMKLHPEIATLVVRADSRFERLEDLKNRTISAGEVNSGHFATYELLETVADWPESERSEIVHVSPADQAARLCDGTIDAFFNMVGHPNASVSEANDLCGVRVLSLDPGLIADTAGLSPGLTAVELPHDLYGGFVFARGNSLATYAILTTTVEASDEMVSTVARSVRNSIDGMRQMNTVFAQLTAQDLFPDRVDISAHGAAVAALKSDGNGSR